MNAGKKLMNNRNQFMSFSGIFRFKKNQYNAYRNFVDNSAGLIYEHFNDNGRKERSQRKHKFVMNNFSFIG
jgi:hypothetical protein